LTDQPLAKDFHGNYRQFIHNSFDDPRYITHRSFRVVHIAYAITAPDHLPAPAFDEVDDQRALFIRDLFDIVSHVDDKFGWIAKIEIPPIAVTGYSAIDGAGPVNIHRAAIVEILMYLTIPFRFKLTTGSAAD
jgi:hypothetical protein